jgi:hypothetical protein
LSTRNGFWVRSQWDAIRVPNADAVALPSRIRGRSAVVCLFLFGI